MNQAVMEDKMFGLQLLTSLFHVDRTPLLEPNPHRVYSDKRVGRMLALGHTDFVFKESRVPDYRIEQTEDGAVDVQNLARYEMYLERLGKYGVDPCEFERRLRQGFKAKARIRIRFKNRRNACCTP